MIIGAGIFALPGEVAGALGSKAWTAYAVCGVAVGLVLLCFAYSGSRVSTTGGPYMYVRMAFGEFPSFLAGLLFWVSTVLATAGVATVFADTLGAVVPDLSSVPGRITALGILYGTAMAINLRGVGIGAWTVVGLACAKVLPLVGLVLLAGILWMTGHLPSPAVPASQAAAAEPVVTVGAVGSTALFLVFAFGGAETALAPSGEVRRPTLTVPLAIGIALGVVLVLYLALQGVTQAVLGSELTSDPAVRAAPLVAVGNRLIGTPGMAILTVAMLVSTAGYVFGDMLASPRLLYAMSEDGYLPRPLGRLHVLHATPAISILVHGALAALLAISGTFEKLAILNNVAFLPVYFGCCLGVVVLMRREKAPARNRPAGETPSEPFKLPLGPVVPILACGFILFILAQAKLEEFAAVGVALVVTAVAYGFRRRTASSVPTN